MIDRIDNELGFKQKALNLRAYRQELLASNIANADTPHYKARDVDFKAALGDAVSGRMNGVVTMTRTAPGHLSGAGASASAFGAATRYRTEFQSNVDGNTVNMDVERSAFAENSVHLEALLTFIRGDFKDLTSAIQGQ